MRKQRFCFCDHQLWHYVTWPSLGTATWPVFSSPTHNACLPITPVGIQLDTALSLTIAVQSWEWNMLASKRMHRKQKKWKQALSKSVKIVPRNVKVTISIIGAHVRQRISALCPQIRTRSSILPLAEWPFLFSFLRQLYFYCLISINIVQFLLIFFTLTFFLPLNLSVLDMLIVCFCLYCLR